MKLKVYQQGGGLIYTPFIPGRTQSTFSGSSSNDGDDSKIDPLDKEILGLMKDQNLLPSDIQAISTALINFQKQTQHLGNPITGGSNNYRSVMPGMLQIMNMVSVARHNREFWNDKLTEIQKHDAGSEVAMDSYGRMWVQDVSDGKLTKIEASKFDKEKYNPVSNSQLMYLRQREYGFGDNILGEGGMDVIGAKDLREEIDTIINEFGKVTAEQYIPGNMQELASDIKEKGIFKVGQERSKGELNDFSGLLYSQLGSSAQHLLNARAALTGYSPIEYLQSVIFSNIDKKDTISYDASLSKAANSGSGGDGGSTQLTQDNYLIQLGNMQLTRGQTAIVPRASEVGDRYGLIFDAYKAGSPVDDKLGVLGPMSFSEFRTTAWAAKAGDTSSVTFGNRILNPDEYGKIMYDGASELNVAMLPFKRDPETGKVMPDLEVVIGFNEIMKELERNPDMSQTELLQLFKSKGLSINDFERGKDGKLTFKNDKLMPFMTVSAYASDDTMPLDKTTKRFLEHLDSSAGKQVIDQFSNMLVYGKTNPAKSDRKINKHVNTPERWDMYRGNVYIPMDNAHAAMLLSGVGQYVPKSVMNNYAPRTEIRMAEVAANNAAQQDPNYNVISGLGQFKN